MIDYKITYVKTDLKEVTEEDVYNKSFQVFYNNSFWDIQEVDDKYYHILEIDLFERFKNNPMGILIEKSKITEIYKPVIELIDESFNQLLLTKELEIICKDKS